MTLEDLVPPLELCKQIPEGEFSDSALVCDYYGTVYARNSKIGKALTFVGFTYPAPTLAEIVSELTPGEDGCGEITQFGKDKRGWFMMASFEGNDDGYGSGIDTYEEKDDTNPATAALELWLAVTSDKSETKKEQ